MQGGLEVEQALVDEMQCREGWKWSGELEVEQALGAAIPLCRGAAQAVPHTTHLMPKSPSLRMPWCVRNRF